MEKKFVTVENWGADRANGQHWGLYFSNSFVREIKKQKLSLSLDILEPSLNLSRGSPCCLVYPEPPSLVLSFILKERACFCR